MQEKKNLNEEEQRGELHLKDISVKIKLQPLDCEVLMEKTEVSFETFKAFYETELRTSARQVSQALIGSAELEDDLFEKGIKRNQKAVWRVYMLSQLNLDKGKINMISPFAKELIKQITIFSTDLSKIERDYNVTQMGKEIRSLNLIAQILLASKIVQGLDSKLVKEFLKETSLTNVIKETENILPSSDTEEVMAIYSKIKALPIELQEYLSLQLYRKTVVELELLLSL